MRIRRTLPTLVGLSLMSALIPLGAPPPVAAAAGELFFSEYLEGSSNNKALEIYNDTGAAVNLATGAYSVQMFFNGNAAAGLTINLTGTVAQGDVYVVAHSSASPTILAQADQTNGAGWFNGDDAVVLRKGAANVDIIGQIGLDPGTEWGSGLTSTADNDLRRKGSVTAGDTTGDDAFVPSAEWDGFPNDTVDDIGQVGDSAPSIVASNPADGALGIAVGTNIDITFSEQVDVAGSWFSISCGTSGAHSASVSGGPTTWTLDPDTDFAGGEVCTVTVLAAQVTDEDAADPPNTMTANGIFSFTTAASNPCTLSFTPVYTIQGSGNATTTPGSVTTQGVVTADFEGTAAASGFYLQDASGDGDPATSDGIFVFTGNADQVSVGDVVRVTGFARERFNQTTINGSNSNTSAVTQIVDCGTAALPAPVDVTLPFASLDFPERFEGMLVNLPQDLVIAEYFNYDRFGEIVLAKPLAGDDRPFTPTAVVEPGAPAIALAEANALSRITLDDVQSVQNPVVLRHPNGDPFTLANGFRGGDLVANTVGVMGYDFNLYRILPTGPADYTAVNPRPAAPAPVGGQLRIAAMNTLNFFLTLDAGPDICGPAENVECRGADDANEFNRQRAKLIAALKGLNADVIGLNELENTPGVDPLANIVAGLNAELGAGTYAYIDTGTIGTDAIRVGLIYRPAAVTPVGAFAILNSSVDPRFIDTKSRPTLAQTFADNSTGERFTLAVNHLKSKGSDCNDLGDPDTGDGQGNCAGTRELAAQALVDWLATDPTGSGDADFLIMGDLNSYAMEDSIDAVKAGADDVFGTGDDFTNLIAKFQGPDAYSYLFDAQFGYLDHALASASMVGQVTGAADWHINSDEADVLDYDTSFKPDEQDALYQPNAYRSSDHDPVVVGLNLVASSGKVTGGGRFAGGSFSVDTTDTSHFTLPGGAVLVSTAYDWLTVSGKDASLQGEGSLDGVSGYTFRVVVHDGGSPAKSDRLRLVVWDPDGEVVYDSQPGDPLTAAPTTKLLSGSVTVH